MTVRMRALKTFKGRPGEGDNGRVRAGREFDVADQRRADSLERIGNAVPLRGFARGKQAVAKTIRKAGGITITSPSSRAGGKIGGGKSASSSRRVRAPKTAPSAKPEDVPAS